MAWMPEAIRKEIPRHNTRTTTQRNRVNYHVAVSEALSLYGFFSGAGACSHFYVRKDGVIEQYISTAFYSAADYQGNDATISVETQGGVNDAQGEPWTDAQVAALARIAVWVAQTHPSIPLSLAIDSRIGASSKGLSYHRLGIDPWRVSGGMKYSTSRGKVCPGNAKIAQMGQILALATGGTIPAPPVPVPSTPVGNGGGVKNWLQQGDSGNQVSLLQMRLKDLGWYTGKVDGSFGPQTLASVRAFQMAAGLVIDGLAGPATMSALGAAGAPRATAPVTKVAGPTTVLRRGSRGEAVRVLQRALKNGYPLYASKIVVDGLFGPATEAVVKEFQRRSNIEADGLVGPITRARLGI